LGTAYTPGLKVSSNTTIEKLRRLPLKGSVLVGIGDLVEPHTVVARTELPGPMQTIKLAEQMGVEASELRSALRVGVGDRVDKGSLLAQTKGLFGWFRSEFKSPVAGVVEMLSEQTGHVGIRMAPTPVEKDAYIRGVVKQVIPQEGVVVQCRGALVQGIFGVGGERQGKITVVATSPDATLTDAQIGPEHAGCVVIGGANVTGAALRRAAAVGAVGIVVGGVVDRDLIEYLREVLKDPTFDIGVAITGHEPTPFTLVVTEGFGSISMATRTFELLRSLEGRSASINGATQIRAGVIRPEVIAPSDADAGSAAEHAGSGQLAIGTQVRVIREPYFGVLGHVTGLPPELQQVDSETHVRVLQARLDDGRDVTVPRANIEIIDAV
jgi:hypothetical protein